MFQHAGASACLCGGPGPACHRRHPSPGRIAGGPGERASAQNGLERGCALRIQRSPSSISILLGKTEAYQIFRYPEGGRKDVLRWTVQGETPVAELEVYRPGGEFNQTGPTFAGIAARMPPAEARARSGAGRRHRQRVRRGYAASLSGRRGRGAVLPRLTAGNEPNLAELFARAELKRGSCAASPTSAASVDWVSSAENLGLRGTL